MTKRIFHASDAIKFSGDTDSLKVVFSEDRKSVGFITDFPASAFDIEELVIYENIEQTQDNEFYKDLFISEEAWKNAKNWQITHSEESE